MNTTFKSRNFEITPALREYTEKRLDSFSKILGVDEAIVSMSVIKWRHRVEVTIPYNGMIVRGEEETTNMYGSIDLVVEKLESQIEKYKNKLTRKKRVSARDYAQDLLAVASDNISAEGFDDLPVRTKHFAVKPMLVEEAIMQMNLLGHNFFVFVNSEDNTMNVVYMRNDGGYGLLVPEV